VYQGREVRAQGYHGLVRSDQKVSADNATFSIWVFRDPAYRKPLVLITNLPVSPEAVLCLYRERWPVEQIPQVAKPLLGLERQWVFAPESIWRLPELALLAANMLALPGGGVTADADRVLGSAAPTESGTAAAGAGPGGISPRFSAGRENSGKTFGDGPSSQGHRGSSASKSPSQGWLKGLTGQISSPICERTPYRRPLR
jgi:hypothetical protein